MTVPSKILQVQNLSAAYEFSGVWLEALREISLTIEAGQSYALVGESGSGKTTLALAVLNYLGRNGRVQNGRVQFNGQNLLELDDSAMRRLWGVQLSLVPQNPLSALNPSMQVGEQMAESIRLHLGLDRSQAAWRVRQELERVHLADPDRVARSYPHQLSGGMLQRILLAMALSARPRLLVLDEPTTNLDVTTQAEILDLIAELIQESQTAVLYVTHNLGVVAQICDRAAVLYAGELVEDASVHDLFNHPLHPYTRALLECLPRIGGIRKPEPLYTIPGSIPALGLRPAGCVFAPRCPVAIELCQQRPLLVATGDARLVRCHRWEEITAGQVILPVVGGDTERRQRVPTTLKVSESKEDDTERVLTLRKVGINFNLGRTLRELITKKPAKKLTAVSEVNLDMSKSMTLGLVGESGSGKTTLARAILGLVERTAGEIELAKIPLPVGLVGRSIESLRQLQMVFQNPDEALNPYHTVGEILRQPVMRLQHHSRQQADQEVLRLLSLVRLPENYANHFPGELSGGEKQRVAIARAIASQPELLVTDEPVSSLDVSVQASIINLLNQLQVETGAAILFISHDLAVTCYLADVVAVIYLGQLMQISRAQDFYLPPFHPYTEALLSTIPRPDPTVQPAHIRMEGEIPSLIQRPGGCPFHPRCPRRLGDICAQQEPAWQTGLNGSRIYCHIPLDQLSASQQRAARPSNSVGTALLGI